MLLAGLFFTDCSANVAVLRASAGASGAGGVAANAGGVDGAAERGGADATNRAIRFAVDDIKYVDD